MKCRLAAAPVDVQVLGQERGDDQPRAVVHPAPRAELAHPGVDHREAGAALAPGLEALVVVLPLELVHRRLMGVVGVAGVVEQHVGVEVAPRELAAELGRPLARAGRPLLELARGDAAEVQVGRELGGAALEPVVAVGVARRSRRAATRACASRAACSPGANGSAVERQLVERGDRGRRSHPLGSSSLRGAPWTSRRSSRSQARQNGENTLNGLPSFVRGLPTSATKRPGWRTTSTPDLLLDAPVARHRVGRDVARRSGASPRRSPRASASARARGGRGGSRGRRRARAAPRAARAGSRAGSSPAARSRGGRAAARRRARTPAPRGRRSAPRRSAAG